MRSNIRISEHARDTYCLRHYNDLTYHLYNPITEELEKKVASAHPSKRDPRKFFKGNHLKGIKARDITLLEDDSFIYAIRRNTLITILSIPGKDPISDLIKKVRKPL